MFFTKLWCLSALSLSLASLIPASALASGPEEAYVYPVRPGTPAWAKLRSHEEMIDAVQIPEGALAEMSTARLVQASLDYPLLGDLRFHDRLQHGFERVAGRSNVLSALLARPDAGRALIEAHRSVDPAALDPAWSIGDRGRWSARLGQLELMLAQKRVLAGLSAAERQALAREALLKLKAMETHPEVYGAASRAGVALLVGRIVAMESGAKARLSAELEKSPNLGAFLRNGGPATKAELRALFDLAETL